MNLNSNNKDKSMFYSKMKYYTNYDYRWLKGNTIKYDTVLLKRTSEKIYNNSKKSILKYYEVDFCKD